jgi:hypothetical protein
MELTNGAKSQHRNVDAAGRKLNSEAAALSSAMNIALNAW